MSKMKRATAWLLALALVAVLSACTSSSGIPQTDPTKPSSPTAEATDPPTAPPTDPSRSPETEPSTQPATDPPTDPPTQPPTDPPTVPATDPIVIDPSVEGFTPPPIRGAMPESGYVDSSWFDDAVFVGDSVSMMLEFYDASAGVLGKSQFLTAGSLGSGNALWDVSDYSVHPTYNGVKMRLEESIPLTGAKKLYIMLGMNDVGLYGVDGAVENMTTLINLIQSSTPGLSVYIQSMTPVASSSNVLSSDGLNNYNIYLYNQKLSDVCQTYGWHFLDVGSVMYDENGWLREEYCSDLDGMGLHFTYTGCAAWVEYLYTHAG